MEGGSIMLFSKELSKEELSYGRLLNEIANEGSIFEEPEYEEEVEAQYED